MIVKGQMARTSVIGPTQGIASVSGRAPVAAPAMPRPVKAYWASAPTGLIRTPSTTALPIRLPAVGGSSPAPATPPTPGGPCCG